MTLCVIGFSYLVDSLCTFLKCSSCVRVTVAGYSCHQVVKDALWMKTSQSTSRGRRATGLSISTQGSLGKHRGLFSSSGFLLQQFAYVLAGSPTAGRAGPGSELLQNGLRRQLGKMLPRGGIQTYGQTREKQRAVLMVSISDSNLDDYCPVLLRSTCTRCNPSLFLT